MPRADPAHGPAGTTGRNRPERAHRDPATALPTTHRLHGGPAGPNASIPHPRPGSSVDPLTAWPIWPFERLVAVRANLAARAAPCPRARARMPIGGGIRAHTSPANSTAGGGRRRGRSRSSRPCRLQLPPTRRAAQCGRRARARLLRRRRSSRRAYGRWVVRNEGWRRRSRRQRRSADACSSRATISASAFPRRRRAGQRSAPSRRATARP